MDKKWSHSPRGFQQEAPQHELDRICKERETALGLALERWVWFGRFDLRGLVRMVWFGSLIWKVWFGRFWFGRLVLVGLVWHVWFGRLDLTGLI